MPFYKRAEVRAKNRGNGCARFFNGSFWFFATGKDLTLCGFTNLVDLSAQSCVSVEGQQLFD